MRADLRDRHTPEGEMSWTAVRPPSTAVHAARAPLGSGARRAGGTYSSASSSVTGTSRAAAIRSSQPNRGSDVPASMR